MEVLEKKQYGFSAPNAHINLVNPSFNQRNQQVQHVNPLTLSCSSTSTLYIPSSNGDLLKDILHEDIEYKKFTALQSLLIKFKNIGLTSNTDEILKISAETYSNSITILHKLKQLKKPLPKVSPDEDCSLSMIWENNDSNKYTILNVDGNFLHIVINSSTNKTQYFDNIQFNQHQQPIELLYLFQSI